MAQIYSKHNLFKRKFREYILNMFAIKIYVNCETYKTNLLVIAISTYH